MNGNLSVDDLPGTEVAYHTKLSFNKEKGFRATLDFEFDSFDLNSNQMVQFSPKLKQDIEFEIKIGSKGKI
jgi:hypothetical protein